LARYFFHIRDGHDMPDPDGTELPDMKAVRMQAIDTAGAILRDLNGSLGSEEWMMDVRDDAGQSVLTLRFSATEHAR
jgi:hypothetical protein